MEIEQKLNEVADKLASHEKRISDLECLLLTKPITEIKELSITEFILSKNPKDDVQRTLAIGYFLEKYKNYESFNIVDLERCFRESKIKAPPQNMNDKVNKNISKGNMMEAEKKKDGKKAWVLTYKGEQVVKSDFKGD